MIWSRVEVLGMVIESIHSCGWLNAHHISKGVWGHTPPGKFRAILVHSEHKICDLLWAKIPFMVDYVWNTTNFYHDNGQLAFYKINVVVSILVSVYRPQHRADTPTVHHYCILHTRLQATYTTKVYYYYSEAAIKENPYSRLCSYIKFMHCTQHATENGYQ